MPSSLFQKIWLKLSLIYASLIFFPFLLFLFLSFYFMRLLICFFSTYLAWFVIVAYLIRYYASAVLEKAYDLWEKRRRDGEWDV